MSFCKNRMGFSIRNEQEVLMKLKKLGAAFLALCMILTLLPATAFAAAGTATDVSKLTMAVVCNSGESIEIGTNADLTITVTNPTAKDIDLEIGRAHV